MTSPNQSLPLKLWSALDFTPHADQLAVYLPVAQAIRHDGGFRFFDIVTGRQWGKTTLAATIIIEGALSPADEFGPPVVKLIADTYEHTNLIWDVVTAAFLGIPALKNLMRGTPDRERGLITLKTGATIQRLSAERPQSLTGFTATLAVIDEAAFVSDASVHMLLPCLAVRQGIVVAFGTAEGIGWHRDWYFLGQDDQSPQHTSWSFPSTSSPYFPPQELDIQKRLLPLKRFRQLYLAEWQGEEGAVFHGVENCIVPYISFPVPPEPGRTYVIGADVAKTGDYSVVTVLDAMTKRVVAWDRFHESDWYAQAARVANWAKKYNNCTAVVDSTGMGDAFCAILRKEHGTEVQEFVFTHGSKEQLVSNLVVAVEREQVRFPDLPVLKREMMFFEARQTPSGRVTYSAPGRQHDDAVMSLALALWGSIRAAANAAPKMKRQEGRWESLSLRR